MYLCIYVYAYTNNTCEDTATNDKYNLESIVKGNQMN